ncbi:MAG: copper homeostasis protein CutC [Anaerolineales bacterium]
MTLEVVVETCGDALEAEAGGADQIEVKCDYLEYGLTPTAGMLAEICGMVSCDVLCMVRPHARSNVYSSLDIAAMVRDIHTAKILPIKGFLLGCLTADNQLDLKSLEYLQEAAGDLDLHFHLAWELTKDPFQTLKQLVTLGFKSVRTSGGDGISGQAGENFNRIIEYADFLQGDLDLFLAGGITVNNIAEIISATGINNVHSGSGVREPNTRTGKVSGNLVQAMKLAMDSTSPGNTSAEG